ncbi:MAG: LUD domain-containing protein [Candidatus Dormibacteraeota bacterium]|nr:LUD domain-containing protein [Candidatus Dormibacteraeota bacterium]
MPETRRHFRRRVREALADPSLQRAQTTSLPALRQRRAAAFQSFDFAAGREELKGRRRANLDHLPELLNRFRINLEAVGGVFHMCHDAAEARQVVGEICVAAGAKLVTKSKSMATEEIGLNQHLEGLGIEPVETDLGEFIMQRLGQHPSHILAPAVHLTVEDWARELGTEPDKAAILDRARTLLREKFINADVGISGANAAIAETGTVMIVTNEGNADLTITLPRVHIALFGLDKVVASLDDAVAMLRMLPRSATGQTISTYVNWVTGPSRSADIGGVLQVGAHGPREMHCVVIDNGRSEMLADPIFRTALTCVRCAACLNACPAFMAVGGHQFGHVYSGPIGLVVTPFHHGAEAAEFPVSLCAQCNACQEACPVDIPLPRQILEHRRSGHRKTLRKRLLLDTWASPPLARAALGLAAPLSRVLPLSPLPLSPVPYRRRARPDADPDLPPVTIFASCMGDRMQPRAVAALERVLRASGHSVRFPREQWCCGLMCANAGDFARAASLSRGLASALAASPGPVVTPSTSCFGAVTADSREWGEATPGAEALRARMRDATRFCLDLLRERPSLVRPAVEPEPVAYHDSCQSERQLGLFDEPRELLRRAGYAPVDARGIGNCCGFGGTFMLDWPEVADRLAEWKLDAVAATGCDVLASDNPGCLLHLEAAARRRGLRLRVAHVLELVAERLTPAPPA